MEKDILEKFKEFVEKENGKDFESHKKDVKKSAMELLDEAEQVQVVLTEKGCTVQGSPVDILCAVACLLDGMKKDKNVPVQLMRKALEETLEAESLEVEEDGEIDKLFKALKDILD